MCTAICSSLCIFELLHQTSGLPTGSFLISQPIFFKKQNWKLTEVRSRLQLVATINVSQCAQHCPLLCFRSGVIFPALDRAAESISSSFRAMASCTSAPCARLTIHCRCLHGSKLVKQSALFFPSSFAHDVAAFFLLSHPFLAG